MAFFSDPIHENFESDFGFMSPHRTKKPCSNPAFAENTLHRIAIMKDYHIGSKGDREETGLPGWCTKFICSGCGKRFKIKGNDGFFYADSSVSVGRKI